MSRVIASLTETGYSTIADELYCFIQDHDELPAEDQIIALFKNSIDLSNYGHKINRLFINCAKKALLKAASIGNQEQISKLLHIEENFQENDSTQDRFSINFLGLKYQDPEIEELQSLYKAIKTYDTELLNADITAATTFTLTVPYEAVARIKEIDTEDICEPLIDSSGGLSNTHIIELGYLRERAETLGKHSHSYCYYESIWMIISDYIPEVLDLKVYKPEFLVLYVNNED